MLRSRAALALALAVALCLPARATWSVVIYNRVTGECGVAVSTCLPGFAVGPFVPVLVVGEGAAAAQSFVDTTGATRVLIRDGLLNGDSPATILANLAAFDPAHQTRQYGIAGRGGPPVGFSGTQNFQAALHRAGSVGDWDYAIQGNILTGAPVVLEAEAAFLASTGDAAERLMTALEAGRLMGGDGRCSCSQAAPTSCGSPPPNFTHTGSTAWIGVARPGDVDGACGGQGCALGSYYLRREFNLGNANIDAVTELIRLVRIWRDGLAGHPDHFLSEVTTSATVLQADGGQSRASVDVRLVDLDGVPLTAGGAILIVTVDGDPIGVVGPVTDHNDGTYSFDVASTAVIGEAELEIVVHEPIGRPVHLWPPVRLRSVAPVELHAAVGEYSVAEGTRIPFVLRRPTADAGRPYRVLGSFTGTQPGTLLGALAVPLNRDRLFEATSMTQGALPYQAFTGVLDGAGDASPVLDYPPGALAPIVGTTLAFAAVIDAASVTNVTSVLVTP